MIFINLFSSMFYWATNWFFTLHKNVSLSAFIRQSQTIMTSLVITIILTNIKWCYSKDGGNNQIQTKEHFPNAFHPTNHTLILQLKSDHDLLNPKEKTISSTSILWPHCVWEFMVIVSVTIKSPYNINQVELHSIWKGPLNLMKR